MPTDRTTDAPTEVLRSGGEWASTVSSDAAADALRKARVIDVTTHTKPDGDALGSSLGLARALEHAGRTARVTVAGPTPRWMAQIAGKTQVRVVGQDTHPALDGDLIAVVDTGSWSQLAEVKPALVGHAARVLIVDHHLHGDPEIADRRVVDARCASTTQVLAPICARLCGVESPAKLPLDVAEPLYLGLATDTGWLRYSSVTPATLRLAADLLEAGVDHTRLYRMIEQQDVPGRWALLGRALGSLSLHRVRAADDAAIMTLSLVDFAATGAGSEDTSGFADMLLTVASVEVSCVLCETPQRPGEPPMTKISARSKPGPLAVDVNSVCKRLLGGGHARAAGAKPKLALADAKAALLKALREEMTGDRA